MTIYTKVCTKCKISKPYTEFSKDRRSRDGHVHKCRSCFKQYYEDRKEEIEDHLKQYRRDNQEKIAKYNKKYQKANKEKISNQKKLKKKLDPLYSMSCRIRSLISTSIKANGFIKKSRSYEILGCSYEEFITHIEKQFTEGMSWDNRSDWHLDHITPVSWGKSEEEIIALNHYSNFKPMWAKDNWSKGNRFSG